MNSVIDIIKHTDSIIFFLFEQIIVWGVLFGITRYKGTKILSENEKWRQLEIKYLFYFVALAPFLFLVVLPMVVLPTLPF